MPIAWHPKRWWNFCMSEDKKKEIDPIFNEKCYHTNNWYSSKFFMNVLSLSHRKLCMKTWYNSKIFMDFDNFSCLVFGTVVPKYILKNI